MEGIHACTYARYSVHRPSVLREVLDKLCGSEHQLFQFKGYIDWQVSWASFPNANRMNTLAFRIYDDTTTYSNTTAAAVSPESFRRSTNL